MRCTLIAFMLIFTSIFNRTHSQITKRQPNKSIEQIKTPKIEIVYPRNGTVFDRGCANFLNKPIKEDWIKETAERLNEFQSLWQKDGDIYLKTAFNEIGMAFPYQEMQATLTVCAIASMSSPLLINVKPFLKTAEKPFETWAFAEILFHELMHTYVRPVNDSSLLRKKYAAELPVVLNHLHVMALEKFVLTKLGKIDILKWIDTDYRTGDLLPAYKRAWEIVNDIEGYEPFIKELKSISKNSKF